MKISWIKRYATDRLDNHGADNVYRELKLRKRKRAQILTWGHEALTCIISNKFPCIEGFFKEGLDFKTSFLLHSPIFFNPWILRNPSDKDLEEFGKTKQETEYLKPEAFAGTRK